MKEEYSNLLDIINHDHTYSLKSKCKIGRNFITSTTKHLIVDAIDNGMSIKNTANTFGLPYSSTAKIYRNYALLEKVDNLKRGGNKATLLNEADINIVKEMLQEC